MDWLIIIADKLRLSGSTYRCCNQLKVSQTNHKPIASVHRTLRSPAWSPDARTVVYEKVSFRPVIQNRQLYSWDPAWDYRHTAVFPGLSRDGKLVLTEKTLNSSIVIMSPDGSDRQRIFDVAGTHINQMQVKHGMTDAFAPAWSPDGQWIAFGLGQWFQARRTGRAMRMRRDGSAVEALTDGIIHSGFPGHSADGRQIVYRVWGKPMPGCAYWIFRPADTRADHCIR